MATVKLRTNNTRDVEEIRTRGLATCVRALYDTATERHCVLRQTSFYQSSTQKKFTRCQLNPGDSEILHLGISEKRMFIIFESNFGYCENSSKQEKIRHNEHLLQVTSILRVTDGLSTPASHCSSPPTNQPPPGSTPCLDRPPP